MGGARRYSEFVCGMMPVCSEASVITVFVSADAVTVAVISTNSTAPVLQYFISVPLRPNE
jgi:hypothetical protein